MSYTIEQHDGSTNDGRPYYAPYRPQTQFRTWLSVCHELDQSSSPLWYGYDFRITDHRTGLVVFRENITDWETENPDTHMTKMTKKTLPWAHEA